MRQITEDAANAFYRDKLFNKSNTQVAVSSVDTVLRLNGNDIAYISRKDPTILNITNAGWFTNVTKERLNGLSGVKIQQKKGEWFLNEKPWDGKWIQIKL